MAETETTDMPSFGDVDWKSQDEDAAFENTLKMLGETNGAGILDHPFEPGEKADDAQDFDDISDVDLPEEEEAVAQNAGDVPALTDDAGTSLETDDLFGEYGLDDLPEDFDENAEPHLGDELDEELFGPPEDSLSDLRAINFPEYIPHANSNQDLSIPAPAESAEDLLKQSWPVFQKDVILNWTELLPPRNAYHIPKVSAKPPKPLHPTKVRLEVARDQEKAFRSTLGPAVLDKHKRALDAEAKGLVAIIEDTEDDESDEDIFDFSEPAFDEQLVKGETWGNVQGITWGNLVMACHDWDSIINAAAEPHKRKVVEEDPMDEWEREFLGHSAKKQKIVHHDIDVINRPQFSVPSSSNFEEQVARIAKRPFLDMSDPYLLLETHVPQPPKRQRITGGFKRGRHGGQSNLSRRFNLSNDEAYETLKYNQRTFRVTQANKPLEHSLPALKLQWPFYKIAMTPREARYYHRPGFKVVRSIEKPIHFSKLGIERKKKNLRGKKASEIFRTSRDLSLSDYYSTATLLEYSEEHPIILSNFGMHNKIINYRRSKVIGDTERPDVIDGVGEEQILQPEEKSPFGNFGVVDSGETMRSVQNDLFKAPIFKHETRNTDFLICRNHTEVNGTSWYVRNIDHAFVVGQQFPEQLIPKEGARKVQTVSKSRLKTIGERLIRHGKKSGFSIDDISKHTPGAEPAQNRAKLKEFFNYDKNEKLWLLKNYIRSDVAPVAPEDVCLIDAMQVGKRYLLDSGLTVENGEEEPNVDDEKNIENMEKKPIAQQLAPWETSKAFLDAKGGKAMLKLHGEGDPSGCGLAFSFIRTSMKGGYLSQGPAATSAGAIAGKGGHKYNVKTQEELYNNSIRNIWTRQKETLSDPVENDEDEFEREEPEEDERFGVAQTPASMATPAGFDDSASQFSMGNDHRSRRFLRVTRTYLNEYGQLESVSETVEDPQIAREYQKRHTEIEAEKIDIRDLQPTGDPELDRLKYLKAMKEKARIQKNMERRLIREKLKSNSKGGKRTTAAEGTAEEADNMEAGSPSSTPMPSIEKPSKGSTTRKCANCGQVGHIKTNKRACPMLNGTWKTEDSGGARGGQGSGGGAGDAAPSFA